MDRIFKLSYEDFSKDETIYYGFIRLNLGYNYNPYSSMQCPSIETGEDGKLEISFSGSETGPETVCFKGTPKAIYDRVFIPYLRDSEFYIDEDSVLLSRIFNIDRLDSLITIFENYFSPLDFNRPQFPFVDASNEIRTGIFYEKYPLSTYSSLANIELLTISEKADPLQIAEFLQLNLENKQ